MPQGAPDRAPLDNLQSEHRLMTDLYIRLLGGFLQDSVILKANDQEIFHETNVTTHWQLGLAQETEVSLPGERTTLTVIIPTRTEAKSFDVELSATTSIAISLTRSGAIQYTVSSTPLDGE